MAGVDALRMVDDVRTRLVDLAIAENYVRDERLSEAARSVWGGSGDEGGLVSDLWVEGALPGKLSDDTLRSLAQARVIPAGLYQQIINRGVFPAERRLYQHQAETIRRAATSAELAKPSLVISAGTGMGKTEAFLLPMLSDLWSADGRTSNGGMRCLILYPMNALVADQVERIYDWLRGQDRIQVFHFTSATPEDDRQANQWDEPVWEVCRARTRQEARGEETHDGQPIRAEPYGRVPDIVITNYSMLEYMLSRPQDARFFGPDLRCIVLDEAHLYSGVLATEIMMLLRRVRERCGVNPEEVLHIATSATLGGNTEELKQFTADLFSSTPAHTSVIRGPLAELDLGERESPPRTEVNPSQISAASTHEFVTLSATGELVDNAPDVVEELRRVAANLVDNSVLDHAQSENPAMPARFLYAALREAPLIHQIGRILSEKQGAVLRVRDLAAQLFGNSADTSGRDATITLLRLAAAARERKADMPLVPHRLHVLVRAPEGLSLCLNPECSGPDERRIAPLGCLQATGQDVCQYCGHVLLPVYRCDNCGEWALAGYENQDTSGIEPDYYADSIEMRTRYLLAQPANLDLEEVVVDPKTGEKRGHGAPGVTLWRAPRRDANAPQQQCPTCQSSWGWSPQDADVPEWRRTCRRFSGGRPFALSVVAETALLDLPPYPGPSKHWKPALGRRLLCFSDSRSAAARLGPRLTQQHEMQVVRSAMARSAQELEPQGIAGRLEEDIRKLEEEVSDLAEDAGLRGYLLGELEGKRASLASARSGTSFRDFVEKVAARVELEQILDRELGETHRPDSFGQSDWKRNAEAVRKHAEALVAKELERPLKRRISVESVGLLEVVYPGVSGLQIPVLIEEKLSRAVRSKMRLVWPEMVALLLDSSRADGCVDWAEYSPARKWLGESPLAGRWLTRTRGGWSSRRFVGSELRQLRREFVVNILRTAGCQGDILVELSREVLCAVFDQLYELAGDRARGFSWLQNESHHQTGQEEDDRALRIQFDALAIRVPSDLYLCDATRTVWTHSALGWAPIRGCQGTLNAVTAGLLEADPRWGRARREFLESRTFSIGLWAEEHSAQLSAHENRRLQDLFRKGIRNVLSSTTTMELGIDIGGLSGVLLGNAPPGPANHRQRAGRAGRRSDGSSVVITYVRDSSYDREVFHRFGTFLEKSLRKPTVTVERERIVGRHLFAVLFSEFIREGQPARTGAMRAFGQMGTFCGVLYPPRWFRSAEPRPPWPPSDASSAKLFLTFLEQLQSEDSGLRKRLASLASQTPLESISIHSEWEDFLRTGAAVFRGGVDEWMREIGQLREAWDDIGSRAGRNRASEMAKANHIHYEAKALCEKTVIECLADKRFLPRYGFPINLQCLTVRKGVEGPKRARSVPDERYRLERSSLLALREYVPESRVLVGGRVAVSRGLRKHWTDSNLDEALGLQYFALECAEGHVYIAKTMDAKCPTCDGSPVRKPQQLVFPRFGYTTAGWEQPTFGTDVEWVGEQSVCPIEFAEHGDNKETDRFADMPQVRAVFKDEAELLIRNAGRWGYGFAICTRCGFAASERGFGQGRIDLPKHFTRHAPLTSPDPNSFCWPKGERGAPVLRNRVLAAREMTEMVRIEWPGASIAQYDSVYSLGRALILSGARLLELDVRELGLALVPLRHARLGIVIYDTAPGGVGHSRELFGNGRAWIDGARSILYVSAEHHARCRRACLDCILDFSGQHAASHLDRRGALDLLDAATS